MQGKKNRFKERRLIKGLNMEFSGSISDSLEFVEAELEKSLLEEDKRNETKYPFSVFQPILQGTPISIFKKKKLKNMFGKTSTKHSWESNDDIDNEVKTPDSVVEQNGDFGKQAWFTERDSLQTNVPTDETDEKDPDLRYIDDSLEHQDVHKN